MESTRWILPAEAHPRTAVALVAHGLNLRPSRMDALGALLAEHGVEALRVGLSGHCGDFEALRTASRERWLSELGSAYRTARSRADELGVPLHMLGSSLGALLLIDLIAGSLEIRFDRRVLLSPALTPRIPAALFHIPRVLGGGSISLWSASLREYQANPRCTIAAYGALFDSVQMVQRALPRLTPAPTLVLIDPGDELVSYRRLKRVAEEQGWRLLEISTARHRLPRRIRHLVVDMPSVGTEEWTRIGRAITQHLGI